MKPRFLSGAALLLLAGCGNGSLCGAASDAWANFNRKSDPCGGAVLAFDLPHCDQTVSACNDHDHQIAEAYFSCLNRIGTCDPNDPGSFSAAADACGSPPLSSDLCANAIFPANFQ